MIASGSKCAIITDGLRKEGCLLRQVRDGIAELSTAGVEVRRRKALGNKNVALDVLARLPRRRCGCRRGRTLGLHNAQEGSVKSVLCDWVH